MMPHFSSTSEKVELGMMRPASSVSIHIAGRGCRRLTGRVYGHHTVVQSSDSPNAERCCDQAEREHNIEADFGLSLHFNFP